MPHKIVLSAVFLYLVLPALPDAEFARLSAQEKYPVITTEPDRFDFGEILAGELLDRDIKLTNTGDADLLVKQIDFTCGCTIPMIELSSGEEVIPTFKDKGGYVTLKPDEWAVVKLQFQSLGRFGKVTHRMDILSNDPKGQNTRIPIVAQVKRAFNVEPKTVDFSIVGKNEIVTKTVRVESNGIGEFDILGIEKLPPFFSYAQERTMEEGENPVRLMTLTYNGGAPVGAQPINLKVLVDHPQVKNFALLAEIQVFPAVIFKHNNERIFEFVDLGLIESGQEINTQIEVVNEDLKIPYLISRVQCKSKCNPPIETSVTTIEAGMRYVINLTIPPQGKKRFLSGRLQLFSDHPDIPVANLLLKGLYR